MKRAFLIVVLFILHILPINVNGQDVSGDVWLTGRSGLVQSTLTPQSASNGTNIERLAIEEYVDFFENTGNFVNQLNPGSRYVFWIYFNTPICASVTIDAAVLKKDRQVYAFSYDYDDSFINYDAEVTTGCNVIGIGTLLAVPEAAPTGQYWWGVKVDASTFYEVYFPHDFQIVN